MIQPRIIGITGKATAGKSTLARFIASHVMGGLRPYRIAFADEVKRIARVCFGWDGVKDEKGRRLLQFIGTECGRAYNPDIWVEKVKKKIVEDLGRSSVEHVVIIDDVRFDNEAQYIRDNEGVVIRVFGRGEELKGECSGHASESGIPDNLVDIEWNNEGDFSVLSSRAYEFVKSWPVEKPEEKEPEIMNLLDALESVEEVIDRLIEVGNGTTDEDLHDAASILIEVRDKYLSQITIVNPEELCNENQMPGMSNEIRDPKEGV